MAPKARVCFICGRQYMLHSFDIHVVQCRDLFEKRENTKPPKERRKCPTDPTLHMTSQVSRNSNAPISQKELDSLNAAAQQAWTQEALVKCRFCGRSFLPEKIGIHNKSCTADNPARRVDESVNRRPVEPSNNNNNLAYGQSNNFETSVDDGNTIKCNDCGRSFNSQAIIKHAKICRKVFSQKRKPFDSAKARAKGTELADFQKVSKRSSKYINSAQNTASSEKQNQQQLPKWKADSIAFRQAMRNARMVSLAEKQSKATGVPLHLLLPPTQRGGAAAGGYYGNDHRSDMGGGGGGGYVDPSFIQCPHCSRSFNQKAGERHIPHCKNTINKPSRLSGHSGQLSYSLTAANSSNNTPPRTTDWSSTSTSASAKGSALSRGGGGGGGGGFNMDSSRFDNMSISQRNQPSGSNDRVIMSRDSVRRTQPSMADYNYQQFGYNQQQQQPQRGAKQSGSFEYDYGNSSQPVINRTWQAPGSSGSRQQQQVDLRYNYNNYGSQSASRQRSDMYASNTTNQSLVSRNRLVGDTANNTLGRTNLSSEGNNNTTTRGSQQQSSVGTTSSVARHEDRYSTNNASRSQTGNGNMFYDDNDNIMVRRSATSSRSDGTERITVKSGDRVSAMRMPPANNTAIYNSTRVRK